MASIIKSDNGVSSGITGIVQSADSSGQLVLQTTTSGGTATTAVTIDNTQVATFANTLKAPNLQGPAFDVYANNGQGITSSTATKVQLANKVIDTNNCFDSTTNYRFTPTVAGYYLITASFSLAAANYFTIGTALVYKNGSAYRNLGGNFAGGTGAMNYSMGSLAFVVQMNGTTDYLELYVYCNGTSPSVVYNTGAQAGTTFMSGCLLRTS